MVRRFFRFERRFVIHGCWGFGPTLFAIDDLTWREANSLHGAVRIVSIPGRQDGRLAWIVPQGIPPCWGPLHFFLEEANKSHGWVLHFPDAGITWEVLHDNLPFGLAGDVAALPNGNLLAGA